MLYKLFRPPLLSNYYRPNFHRHNLIDQKYSQLKFDLFRFFIVNKNEEFYFHLSQVDEKPKTKIVKINYQEFNWQNQVNENISEPPRILLGSVGVEGKKV